MVKEEVRDLLWSKASIVDNRDPQIWRHDPCGALIKKDEYGVRSSKYGWEEDHVVSRAFLIQAGATDEEIENPENLRAMHWANNDSKGTNYPEYRAVMKEENGDNRRIEGYFTVNEERQNILNRLFSKYGI